MSAESWTASCSAALLLIFGCAALSSATGAAGSDNPNPARITVLYDAFGKSPDMQKDWGYAALVEFGGKRILFDTGNSPDVLAQNAKARNIDLSSLDFVVMSHRHGDHMGGLTYLLKVNPNVRIYAPKEGFGVYGAKTPRCRLSSAITMAPRRKSCALAQPGPAPTSSWSTRIPRLLPTYL